MDRKYLLTLCVVLLLASFGISTSAFSEKQAQTGSQYPPNIDYGQQGDFIAKRATDAGRSAIINTVGPLLVLLPESPGSSDAHVTLRNWDSSWDITDLTNPTFKRYINCYEGVCRNGQGIHAHATHTNFWNGEAYLWSNNHWQLGNSHRYDATNDDTVPASPPWQLTAGRLFAPFVVQDYWSYGAPFSGNLTLYYAHDQRAGTDWRGQPFATWDHLNETGVTGFFSFHGDLLIAASDQASTGMAIYSMNGWQSGLDGNWRPRLLSTYQPQLTQPNGDPIGLGGYWVEPYGANKMVWSAREASSFGRDYPALYVVDFSDPTNPELTCELYFDQDTSDPADGDNMTMPMYVNFQDQYAYVDDMKVDIPACEAAYRVGKASNANYMISTTEMANFVDKFDTHQNHCDASQYFRPLGQVGVFGGYDRFGTEAIITYTGPTFEQGSWTSAGLIAHNFSANRSLVGSSSVQVGQNINGRTVTSVEIDERVNTQGLCFFVTSDSPDTNPPYVSGHRPAANETNVAVDTFISLHIPETLRAETLANAIQLTREDTSAAVPFTHRLSHTGTVTLWPSNNLPDNVAFRVDISGVQDYMGNTMSAYSFRFSTGSQIGGSTPTSVPPTATNMPLPTATNTVQPTNMPLPTATNTPQPVVTNTPNPAASHTPTALPGATETPLPTNTATPLPTQTGTPQPAPTHTPATLPTSTATAVSPTQTPAVQPTDEPAPSATALPPLLNQWISCAQENQVCELPIDTIVRYGGPERHNYLERSAGSITCDNGTFGDPLPGAGKGCDYWYGTAAADYAGEPFYPNQSGQISCLDESTLNNIWVVNPDNNSLTVVDTFLEPGSKYIRVNQQQEIYLNYETPTSVSHIGAFYAVTYRDDDKVVFHDETTFHPIFALDTGHGSQPVASIASEDGVALYVSLYGSGEVIEIDLASRRITSRVGVGPHPKAMALHGDRLLVTRFISPSTHAEVYSLDVSERLTFMQTIMINKVLVSDDINHGSGVPNFLSSVVINRDGTEAFVTAVKANIDRGTGPHSSGVALDDDNTVRPMLAKIDLVNNRDANENPYSPEGTIDFDNAADPTGVTLLVDGESRVVTFQGNNVILAQNERLNTFTQFASGFGPQDMCATARGLYVKNFTGRSVSALDIASYLDRGSRNPNTLEVSTVADELLAIEALQGLQSFYHSSIPAMGLEGYMSCASCHSGGGHDGQTWDMTHMGEGVRNTISLNGASGTRFGNLHWTSNFDEVQDFELQLEVLNRGTGLIPDVTFTGESPLDVVTAGRSAELDALAAYVNGLGQDTVRRSPYRTYDGQLTEEALRGQVIFEARGCASCHAGEAFRDGQMHNVGTLTDGSGNRLFGELTGIRTPTLIELWDSAPYFHNGSAATLDEVLSVGSHQVTLSEEDRAALIEFLLSIDRDMYIADE
ncbi:MAG: Ig-like domain-containing protein [Chloroflexota bacterium]